MRSVIHEMKNHLAIAVANLEAFRDGALDASPARLGASLQALAEVDVLLGGYRPGASMQRPVSVALEGSGLVNGDVRAATVQSVSHRAAPVSAICPPHRSRS